MIIRLTNYCPPQQGNYSLKVGSRFTVITVVRVDSLETMADSELIWMLFSPSCFDLLTKFDINNFIDDGCAASVISKLLGYAIIAGSFALKIPQIIKIMSAKSGAGLSVIAIVIESLGYLVTTAYYYRKGIIGIIPSLKCEFNVLRVCLLNTHIFVIIYYTGYAASTYGESPIIFMQNMIILLLIHSYKGNGRSNNQFMLGLSIVIAYLALFILSMTDYVPFMIINQIFAAIILIVLGSRLPQIYTIYKAGSTGNLAFATWALNFGGAAARLFTTMQEVPDTMALIVICTSTTCNGIIVLQFLIYWNADKAEKKKKQ